jgi:peroxiredoxin
MKPASILFVLFVAISVAMADEFIPQLKVKDEVYTNVTVTEVTAMDIYFTSARGMGNAKLKDLSPELQKHFHYDAAKSDRIEQARKQANVDFQKKLEANKPAPLPPPLATNTIAAPEPKDEDFIAPDLYAMSIRGGPAPKFVVEKWITPIPATVGKFVMIFFWTTESLLCREGILELNAFQAKFKDKLVIIGMSDESEAVVRNFKDQKIDFAVATDTRRRMFEQLKIAALPHCILIDQDGIVRYEGMPQYLDDQKLEHFLTKYGH